MLQPIGKCANVCALAHPNPSPITTSISPLRLEKGIPSELQSCVHWLRRACFLTAQMRRANSSVLAGPRAQALVISPTQAAIPVCPSRPERSSQSRRISRTLPPISRSESVFFLLYVYVLEFIFYLIRDI